MYITLCKGLCAEKFEFEAGEEEECVSGDGLSRSRRHKRWRCDASTRGLRSMAGQKAK
jgi:hypothetical protein